MLSEKQKSAGLSRRGASGHEKDENELKPLTRDDVVRYMTIVLENPALRCEAMEQLYKDADKFDPMKGLDDFIIKLFHFYSSEFYATTGQPCDPAFMRILSSFLSVVCDSSYMKLIMHTELYRAVWEMFPNNGTIPLITEMIACNTQDANDVVFGGNDSYDKNQQAVDDTALKGGWNVVAHFCLANGIADALLGFLTGDVNDDVIDAIYLLRQFRLIPKAFPILRPCLEQIMEFANGHPDVKFRGFCIGTVGTFAGCCTAALHFILEKQSFLNEFCSGCGNLDPVILHRILQVLGEPHGAKLRRGILSRAAEIPMEMIAQLISPLRQCMRCGDPAIQEEALAAIAASTVSPDVVAMYMQPDGVASDILMFVNGDGEFNSKVSAMSSILGMFDVGALQEKARLVEFGIMDVVNDWVESMFRQIPEDFLSFIQELMHLAETQGEASPWFEQVSYLFESENILKAISDMGDFDHVPAGYGMDSPEVWAYSVLREIDTFRARFGI